MAAKNKMKQMHFFSLLIVGLVFISACTASQTPAAIEETESGNQLKLLAGTTSKYYRFDKEHYEQSMKDGKVIFLDFHADWCPICNTEQPHIFAAFNELNNDDVVGYQVHFKDRRTTVDDTEMAKKYGITLQHTKVVVDENGKVASKSLEGFTKEKVFEEINKGLGG